MLDDEELRYAALYPGLKPDEQAEAVDRLKRYLHVVMQIYERTHGKELDHTQEGE